MDPTLRELKRPWDSTTESSDTTESKEGTTVGENDTSVYGSHSLPIKDEDSSQPDPKKLKHDQSPINSIESVFTNDVNIETTKTQNDEIPCVVNVNQKYHTSSRPSTNEETPTTKSSKTTTPVPSVSKEELLYQSGRKVESIIDGSNIRQFLNKTLSTYLVEGLDQIVKMWENGDFEFENENELELKRKVADKFADILKLLADKKL